MICLFSRVNELKTDKTSKEKWLEKDFPLRPLQNEGNNLLRNQRKLKIIAQINANSLKCAILLCSNIYYYVR